MAVQRHLRSSIQLLWLQVCFNKFSSVQFKVVDFTANRKRGGRGHGPKAGSPVRAEQVRRPERSQVPERGSVTGLYFHSAARPG